MDKSTLEYYSKNAEILIHKYDEATHETHQYFDMAFPKGKQKILAYENLLLNSFPHNIDTVSRDLLNLAHS